MVDLAIVTENIEKIRQFQNDNKAEINSAFSNQDAILEEIWTEEQAKIRQEQGLWECVAGVTTVVLGGAAIILSGGAAIPIVLGVATIAFGSSDIIEGTQDVYYGSVGDISSKSFNPLRDTLFFGNQRAYDIAESIVTFAAGSSIPIANAAKAGNVLTSTQKAKIVVSELGKEVIGTGGGFLGVKLGEGLGLSKEESMFLGMAGSIVTSKGADWVDNNWDNLVLAGKYTFSNSGKSVSLGSNGGNVVNDFRETFNKVKASEVLDVDEVKKVEKVTNDVRKTGVGKTGEGIPLEEVKPGVLKQIYPNDNGAYGYLPNEGSAYYKPEYDFTDVDWAKEMQDVRKDYLEASKQLEIDIERMTSEGFSKEDIAKHVVGERNQQKVTARANMTLEERAGLEERNIELYGNPVGPDAQWLFSKTKKKLLKEGTYIDDNQIWEIIIKKSMVKDDVINTLLGLIH